MTGRTAGYNGRDIGRLEDQLLVLIRNIALVGCEEHGAALHALGAQHERRRHAAAVRDAAGRNDRDAQRIDHLRNQRHGRQLTDVAAALHAFRDNSVRARALHALGQRYRRDNRHDLNTGIFPVFHIFARIARACGQHLDFFVDGELREVVRIRGEQHDVQAQRLIRDGTGLANLVADVINRSRAAGNDAETASLGYRRRKMMLRNPRHCALHNRILDTEQFCNLGFH